MSEPSLPSYRDVDADLRRLRLAITPAELHGSLCGYLCAGGEATPRRWLARVLADEEGVDDVAVDGALDRTFLASQVQLESPDFGFELLLPEASEAVATRGEALVEWCRGFLGGFGLGGESPGSLSDEASEALADLGRIAASDLSYDDPDNDEESLAEVAEFVRVAALLLHGDCVLGPRHRRRLN